MNTALIGIAGVHYVASELSRRGLVALPTTRNVAGYDIVVVTPDGRHHANIQVKTSSKRASFFRMPRSAKVRSGAHDVYVLVRWLPKQNRYEGFLLTGRAAKAEVERGERFQRKRIRQGTRSGINASIYVGPKAEPRCSRWKNAWLSWTL